MSHEINLEVGEAVIVVFENEEAFGKAIGILFDMVPEHEFMVLGDNALLIDKNDKKFLTGLYREEEVIPSSDLTQEELNAIRAEKFQY